MKLHTISINNKNSRRRSTFVDYASNLDKGVTRTVYLAKKGDFVGAKAAYENVEKTFAACHAKFRE